MIELTNATTIFKALTENVRIRLIRILAVNKTSMCVCELVDVLHERQYNISKHLKILEQAGLVFRKKEGRWIYYNLSNHDDRTYFELFNIISNLQDKEGQFKLDQKRYEERENLRIDGRCQVGIQTKELQN